MSELSITFGPSKIQTDPDLRRKTGSYKSVADIFIQATDALRKPDRLSVTEVAEQYVKIRRLGARYGSWSRSATPYMVEPQDLLSSRELAAIIFVGSSQSGKTESMILNLVAYRVMQDPMDMIIYSPTQKNARDFSIMRIDRLNAYSPDIRARLVKSKAADNKETKIYSSGMILKLSWPTVSEMAGKPIGCVAITDYDRMGDDVGSEGSPFDLAYMRTTTFGSLRKVVAESSPSRPIEDPRWIASSSHEAPPTKGILALYNRGDRRRWYWPHMACGNFFEGKFNLLKWEDKDNPLDAADTVHMICPHCSGRIKPAERSVMQYYGVWLRDGETINELGEIVGDAPRSHIASFWLNGVAAGFQSWQELVVKFLNATREYEKTGSEEALRQFHNNDLGEPYRSKSEELARLPEVLQSRAEPYSPQLIPENVRFLVACVDVQKSAFVVQVHGISPGQPFDITIIDRFTIHKSDRMDADGDTERVKPASYLQDWDRLIEEVMEKTYPVDDKSGKVMSVKLTVCDSGGFSLHRGEGVTSMAYEFYRSLRKRGLASRFHLVKGEPRPNAPRAHIDFPDQRRKDKMAAARGDVPVLFLNSNVLKDSASARLDCITPGKGMIRFFDWLQPWFYKELCAERRTEKGWQNTQGTRNEAWDLLYYCLGACASQLLQVERVDWMNPPAWADIWERNPLVAKPNDKGALTDVQEDEYNFAALGKTLA